MNEKYYQYINNNRVQSIWTTTKGCQIKKKKIYLNEIQLKDTDHRSEINHSSSNIIATTMKVGLKKKYLQTLLLKIGSSRPMALDNERPCKGTRSRGYS